METLIGINKIRRCGKVLILPMRNGNKYKDDIIRMKIKVLILPMRNGNLLNLSKVLSMYFSFLSYL